MYATECTITINNRFLSLKSTDETINKTPKTDFLQTEIHIIIIKLSDCAFITKVEQIIQRQDVHHL